ncbi:hypothetical protein BUALT_Bualt13G0042800 [Buddleja alternifolia]|uniref:DDT domain-containing protein n=1 Tax=Buddleja alternifolia TaxID=168488 RepID=A0AAV6WTS7_9LAMI|nr:hypothetical protein BUALT_Bualt13G0042800 [Buddleja alternifolia]
MEYVGSRVKKVLQGNVTLFGFVQAFDNGDSKELSLPEISLLLVSLPEKLSVRRPGVMPEKWRRIDQGNLLGLDLIEGENWVLNEGIDLNRRVGEGGSEVGRGLIDLNVDISEGFENVCGEREMSNFDLNAKLTEDEVGDFGDGEGKLGGEQRVCGEGDKQKGKELTLHVDDQLSSPAAGAFSVGRENSEEHIVLPLKVELPSSGSLNLKGVSVLDLISVYVFLRSFSTLLFLSPFELDDFLACMICTDSTLLFDSIHVSLLRTLRIHLESLSNEGSKSAYACHLEPLQSDFYKLPVSIKIQIPQHLCDDVVETEYFRSELSRRSSVMEQNIDLDRHMKFESSKQRKTIMDVASTSCFREDDRNEPSDWNGEECYLCKMDGNLICCDGCPGAFRSRCVGVVSSQLPKGKLYSPECSIDKNNPRSKVRKSIRGRSGWELILVGDYIIAALIILWSFKRILKISVDLAEHAKPLSLWKEKCGWCFYCKNPENNRDCLFVMNDVFPAIENFMKEGLLVGPWLSPHYLQHWREIVLGVADLASIKNLILEGSEKTKKFLDLCGSNCPLLG